MLNSQMSWDLCYIPMTTRHDNKTTSQGQFLFRCRKAEQLGKEMDMRISMLQDSKQQKQQQLRNSSTRPSAIGNSLISTGFQPQQKLWSLTVLPPSASSSTSTTVAGQTYENLESIPSTAAAAVEGDSYVNVHPLQPEAPLLEPGPSYVEVRYSPTLI